MSAPQSPTAAEGSFVFEEDTALTRTGSGWMNGFNGGGLGGFGSGGGGGDRIDTLFSSLQREFQLLRRENALLRERLAAVEGREAVEEAKKEAISSIIMEQQLQPLQHQQILQLQQQHHQQQQVQQQQQPHAQQQQQQQQQQQPGTNVGNQSPSPKRSGARTVSEKIQAAYNAGTSKIVTTMFRTSQGLAPLRKFTGHTDGVWEVNVAVLPDHSSVGSGAASPPTGAVSTSSSAAGMGGGNIIVGTASADKSACLWSWESGACLLSYQGHTGSVNSIRFNPKDTEFVCTASGDGSLHLWRIPNLQELAQRSKDAKEKDQEDLIVGEDQLPSKRVQYTVFQDEAGRNVLQEPVLQMRGHGGVVTAGEWLSSGEKIVSCSWDALAKVWDVSTGSVVLDLHGHDAEVTNVSAHPTTAPLVVTSSRDSTVRLWDIRMSSSHESGRVFHGHTDPVNSARFIGGNVIISSSEDKTIKIWDMRSEKMPTATIRLNAAANRLSASPSGTTIAAPTDNCHVRLFDLEGKPKGRTPRRGRGGHSKMVSCVAWMNDTNFISAGFDKSAYSWKMVLAPEGNAKIRGRTKSSSKMGSSDA